MYPVNYDNKFFRAFAVFTDSYGIDPLKDKIVPKLMAIPSYTVHRVTQNERGAPDLISFNAYNTEDYWWHIMQYNGVFRVSQIVEGIQLKLPDLGAIIAITNNISTANVRPSSQKTIRI